MEMAATMMPAAEMMAMASATMATAVMTATTSTAVAAAMTTTVAAAMTAFRDRKVRHRQRDGEGHRGNSHDDL
ncbi:hypothetical protein [Bradyrhizobium sp. BWA-3-5]|jgi:hypothetical protein|uniref:hypothetical protein n=1 Tax=Bradyrhizobium sp. BWA-3-5 TaxID=3080013 RepID=UPI00293E4D89|nr:hypothetical protein [Bradyrhizobium sp. BWA-3-5]WOH66004.1 hypothetical protein RX331_36725 [Bradyrhizobium sp. BWA-3-5]